MEFARRMDTRAFPGCTWLHSHGVSIFSMLRARFLLMDKAPAHGQVIAIGIKEVYTVLQPDKWRNH